MVSTPKSAKQIEDEESPQQVVKETPKPAAAPSPPPEPVKVGETLIKLPDAVPSHWHIIAEEDGTIVATCSTSRSVFRGTMQEFNAALRNH